MEVTQFTYFQQVGGFECHPVSVEITYGLERLAMYIQGVEDVFDLDYNGRGVQYRDVFIGLKSSIPDIISSLQVRIDCFGILKMQSRSVTVY